MFNNYFKLAIRNLGKGRAYSLINVLGLSIGSLVCILILLFVVNEYSYDKFHEHSDRIYRTWVKEHFQGEIFFNSVTPFILGSTLEEEIPELEEVARYLTIQSLVKNQDFSEEEVIHLVEPSFLEIFDFPVLQGDASLLNELHQVVLTPEMCDKYFGSDDVLGKTITMQVGGEWTDFSVSGIIASPPTESSIQYDILIPFKNVETFTSPQMRQNWMSVYPETYVMVNPGTDLEQLKAKIATVVDARVAEFYEPGEYVVGLQPITDIHLNADVPLGIAPVSDRKYPRILAGIGILIMLLASINFTTLAIGRSVTRAKEVAIRKVSGARRNQLMLQFWTEAILTSFMALTIGLVLAWLLLPYFNLLTSRDLVLSFSLKQLSLFVALAVITGLLAGAYPAMILSGFSPIRSLQGTIGKTKGVNRHNILRWLVGFQYLLSIGLITCTLVMRDQLNYIQNKNLGFDEEHVMVFPYQAAGQRLTQTWEEMGAVEQRLRSALAGRADIVGMTVSNHTIGTPGWSQLGFTDKETERFRRFTAQQISPNYLDLMSIKLEEGRNFHTEPESDLKSAIINRAMAAEFGLEDPIGKMLPGPFMEYQIIGLTDNFQYASLHNPVEPLVMVKDAIPLWRAAPDHVVGDGLNPKVSIKIQSPDLSATIREIENVWLEVAPEQSFEFHFMDEDLDRQYAAESRLGKIVGLATALAIVIACLGLFGIGLLTIAQRQREIGVRKVLGASTMQIMILLNKRFSIIVLLAAVVAIPVSWSIMSSWLEGFAFGVDLSPLVFVLAAAIALVLSWAAVGSQSYLAATANPVDSIRDE